MMANYLAIATATEVLRRRLTDAISTEFPGVQVMSKRPEINDGQAQGQVSIFLYRITPNAALRNCDLTTRDSEGRPIRRPIAALDLHYLLSFAGDEQELVPQRMLGLTIASLHSAAALSRDEIESASEGGWLGDSDLKNEIELVKFSMSSVTLDDIAKLWTVFPQVPYQLSIGYEASVVLIESDLAIREALPVRERSVDALPINRPIIASVNGGRPLFGNAGLEFEINGRRLRGPVTLVRFDDDEPQEVTTASNTSIVVPPAIATALGAGVHSVLVIHEVPLGAKQVPHRAVESNTFRFVLRPTIQVIHAAGNPNIVVSFFPPVQERQIVRLLLNEVLDPPPTNRDLRFRTLEAVPSGASAPWAQLTFNAGAIAPGTYIVRARVDDAESSDTYTAGNGAPQSPHVVTLP